MYPASRGRGGVRTKSGRPRHSQSEDLPKRKKSNKKEDHKPTQDVTNTANFMKPPSPEIKAAICNEINSFFAEGNQLMKACACCDEDCPQNSLLQIDLTNESNRTNWIQILDEKLTWDHSIHELPKELKTQYQINFSQLEHVPLSPRGFNESTSTLSLCSACSKTLRSKSQKPPRFAICNGWAMGLLPHELASITLPEIRMCTISPVSALIRVVGVPTSARNRILQSHMIAMYSSQGPPGANLPRREFAAEEYAVIFSGATVHEQAEGKKHYATIRKAMVEKLLTHLVIFIPCYASHLNDEQLHELTDHTLDDNCIEAENGSALIDQILKDQDRVGVNNDLHETTTGLFESAADHLQLPNTTARNTATTPTFHVQLSSDPQPVSEEGFLFAFPTLFPYGQGTPLSPRKVQVPLAQGLAHLQRLSHRAFAQNHEIIFYTFDVLARQRSQSILTVTMKRHPQVAFNAASLDEATVLKLVEHQTKCQQLARAGKQPPPTPENLQPSQSIFNSIKYANSFSHGSKQEREQMRREIHAYESHFGRPHLMLTMTPDDTGSLNVALRSHHVSLSEEQTAAKIETAACSDPTACAQMFETMSNFFLEEIVRFDQKKKTSKPGGGLFGTCKAYYGGIETQGNNRLHWHLIIWLENWPSTEAQVNDLKEKWNALVLEYASTLFHGTYPLLQLFRVPENQNASSSPLTPGRVLCPQCGENTLTALEYQYIWQTSLMKFEPHTSECASCSKKYTPSALRRECSQIVAQILGENFNGLQNETNNNLFDIVALEMPQEWNEAQQLSNSITIFDHLREVIVDASAATTVLSDDIKDFLRATLKLNMALEKKHEHSFKHHASCFENKKCRYKEPHVSEDTTRIDEQGNVLLQRSVGSEYLNPFIRIVFQWLKANFAGRILQNHSVEYCVNYVGKRQKVSALFSLCVSTKTAKNKRSNI